MTTTPRFLPDGAAMETLVFDTEMAPFLRVKIDASGEAAQCEESDKSLGVTWQGQSADARESVRLHHNAGTQVMTASEAISIGDTVYAAADGKVAATGSIVEGVAVTAATADGDLIAVVPQMGVGVGGPVVVARTATADGLTTGTIADGNLFQYVAVTSANAAHIVVLPTPTPGTMILMGVGANGFELRSNDPATVGISGGTGAGVESAIPAQTLVLIVCISGTQWLGFDLTATTLAAIEAAA